MVFEKRKNNLNHKGMIVLSSWALANIAGSAVGYGLTNSFEEKQFYIMNGTWGLINLGIGFQIGHSYFCSKTDSVSDSDWLEEIITFEIKTLLMYISFNFSSLVLITSTEFIKLLTTECASLYGTITSIVFEATSSKGVDVNRLRVRYSQ